MDEIRSSIRTNLASKAWTQLKLENLRPILGQAAGIQGVDCIFGEVQMILFEEEYTCQGLTGAEYSITAGMLDISEEGTLTACPPPVVCQEAEFGGRTTPSMSEVVK